MTTVFAIVLLCLATVVVGDDLACVSGSDAPITRRMDASIPVRFDTPGFNYSNPDISDYPENTTCQWQIDITDPDQTALQLSFRNFSLEFSTDCRFDSVEIRDGGEFGPLLPNGNPICGPIIPDNILIASKSVFVRFVSNTNGIGGNGFLARAGFPFEENTACDGTGPMVLDNPNGGIFSTNEYPLNYDNNELCEWQVVGTPGQRAQIVFNGFELEGLCSLDTLAVFDGDSPLSNRLVTLYGGDLPTTVTGSTENLYLRFTSSANNVYPGFLGNYGFI